MEIDLAELACPGIDVLEDAGVNGFEAGRIKVACYRIVPKVNKGFCGLNALEIIEQLSICQAGIILE
jgi:hypothetical protein